MMAQENGKNQKIEIVKMAEKEKRKKIILPKTKRAEGLMAEKIVIKYQKNKGVGGLQVLRNK